MRGERVRTRAFGGRGMGWRELSRAREAQAVHFADYGIAGHAAQFCGNLAG